MAFGVPVSVFDAYKKIAGCDIEESIKDECTGNLEALLLAVGTKVPAVWLNVQVRWLFGQTEH